MLDNIVDKQIRFDFSKNSKAVIFSDLHFYKHRGSHVFLNTAQKVLESILEYIDANNIMNVIFIGDWFHKKEKVGTEELSISSKFFAALYKRNVNVVLFVGNHDYLYSSELKSDMSTVEVFNMLPNVVILNNYKSFHYKDKAYHFFRWSDDLQREFVKERIVKDKKNYFLGHIELKEMKMNEEYSVTSEKTDMDIEFLNSNFVLSFLGHYHRLMKLGKVIVVGGPYQQNFGEVGYKDGFLEYDFDTDKITLIENNVSPRFRRIFISDLKIRSMEDILKIDMSDSFIKIILNEKIDGELLVELKNHLLKSNHSVEMVFDYNAKDEELAHNSEGEELRKQMASTDLTSEFDIRNFFGVYLDLFKELPEPLDRDRLKEIVNELL